MSTKTITPSTPRNGSNAPKEHGCIVIDTKKKRDTHHPDLAAAVKEDIEQRVAACTAELQEVFTKHNCRLEIMAGGNPVSLFIGGQPVLEIRVAANPVG